jgi:hypothetical protein
MRLRLSIRLVAPVAILAVTSATPIFSSSAKEPGTFSLELALRGSGPDTAIEVRLANSGAPAKLVNRRFALGTRGHPIAELSFEGEPASQAGCKFNIRPARAADFILLGPGELVGRTFSGTAILCFVGKTDVVKLRAHYRIKNPPDLKGPVLDTELTSNEIAISRAALEPPTSSP